MIYCHLAYEENYDAFILFEDHAIKITD